MKYITNWKDLNQIEDGCGGEIYKIFDVEDSGLKNLEMAMCIFNPGEIARIHYHKKIEEVYFILEGEGSIELDGTWYPVKADHTIAIPIGVKHRMKNVSNNNILKFLSINSPEWQLSDMLSASD
jgi:mannose-6-phosphate isomerase-like protein (cupin superfamily)